MKATGLSRVSKDLIIGEIEKEVKARPNFIVTQYGTVSATSLDKLRAKLRQAGSRYFVVKGSLGKKALEKADLKEFSATIAGTCGIAFTGGDPVSPSKVLMDFAKENESFKVQNALINGQVLGPADVKTLASLPSREVLIARVVGGVQAPLSRFVGVLSGTVRKVVNVLDAIAKKKGNS